MLLVILIKPPEGSSIGPLFLAFSMLLAVLPFAYICVTWLVIRAVFLVFCLAVYLSVIPLSFQRVAVWFSQCSEPIGQIASPLAFVDGPAWPCLFALAVLNIIKPLALVGDPGVWANPFGSVFSRLCLLLCMSLRPFLWSLLKYQLACVLALRLSQFHRVLLKI